MFDNKSVFLIVKEDKDDVIYKLETDNSTQQEINRLFEASAQEIVDKQQVPFDGSYTPLEDEVLSISDFIITDSLKDAFRNPIAVDSFVANVDNLQNIKVVCIGYCENTDRGEKFIAAFQRFRKDQYISVDKLNLLFDDNTFKKNNSVGISIGSNIDCLLDGTTLIFNSFYFARQVFDLSSYYRTATDDDINAFLLCENINFGDGRDKFMAKANSWVRRKVALINDSGVLEKYSAAEIKRIAKKHSGLEITVKDKMIVFPDDFEDVKVLLSFLDEESWVGPFTNDTFVSTSKRKVK